MRLIANLAFEWTNNTYSNPEHDVQTKDPIVIFTYVGPLWLQSKHCLFPGKDTKLRKIFRCFSSSFFLLEAILPKISKLRFLKGSQQRQTGNRFC